MSIENACYCGEVTSEPKKNDKKRVGIIQTEKFL